MKYNNDNNNDNNNNNTPTRGIAGAGDARPATRPQAAAL